LFGEDTHHWALARIAFARQPHVPRTTHLDLFSLKAPGNCENRDESFVTFNESKNRPLTLLVPGNHVQRGIRIIVKRLCNSRIDDRITNYRTIEFVFNLSRALE
jgi:hypothetical protein